MGALPAMIPVVPSGHVLINISLARKSYASSFHQLLTFGGMANFEAP